MKGLRRIMQVLWTAKKTYECVLNKVAVKRELLDSVKARKLDKTMNVDGLKCILYARIYIPYMCTILYYYIQTGRPPVPISSELKLKTNS